MEVTKHHITRVRAEHGGRRRPRYYGANVDPSSGTLFDAYAPVCASTRSADHKARAKAKAARKARRKNRR